MFRTHKPHFKVKVFRVEEDFADAFNKVAARQGLLPPSNFRRCELLRQLQQCNGSPGKQKRKESR